MQPWKDPTSVITSDPTLRHSVPDNDPDRFLLPTLALPPPPTQPPPHLVGKEHFKVHRDRVGVGGIVLAFELGKNNPLSSP